MIIRQVSLAAVAAKPSQYPPMELPEIALAGRSNVGKSSLINTLLNRRNFARTSGSPGKTRTVNFYEINQFFRIVDLPGYGYAKAGKAQMESWAEIVNAYLSSTRNLRKVVQLVDIRHEPSPLDVQMYDWIRHYKMDGLVVATKADKVSRNELARNVALIRKTLNLTGEDRIVCVSSLKKTGGDELWEALEGLLED